MLIKLSCYSGAGLPDRKIRLSFDHSGFESFAMSEQRKNVRLRTLKTGVMAFDKSTISCVVRNVSVSGACLEVASPIGIPNAFSLLIESDHIRRPCHVAWMKGKRIGIQFD
jgi:hypothetical protein